MKLIQITATSRYKNHEEHIVLASFPEDLDKLIEYIKDNHYKDLIKSFK